MRDRALLNPPTDQAHGLRRLFGTPPVCHIALVANPHVAFVSVVLERLTTALAALNVNTLVVDAADSSPAPRELAALDLRDGIETLSEQVGYLAARGLPLAHVDTHGSSAHLLERLQAAAPRCRVLLVHASAGDLARLYARHALRPLLLAADDAQSLTHAYASMKLLAGRCGWKSGDLLLAAPGTSQRAPLIAQRLASCAESFLGAALREWVAIDPACDVRDPLCPALMALVAAQLRSQSPASAEAPDVPHYAPLPAAPRQALSLN